MRVSLKANSIQTIRPFGCLDVLIICPVKVIRHKYDKYCNNFYLVELRRLGTQIYLKLLFTIYNMNATLKTKKNCC